MRLPGSSAISSPFSVVARVVTVLTYEDANTQVTDDEELAFWVVVVFLFFDGYFACLPDQIARRSKMGRLWKSVNTIIGWPIISVIACRSINALALVIAGSLAILSNLPDETELTAETWHTAAPAVLWCAPARIARVLREMLEVLDAAENAREERPTGQADRSATLLVDHSVRRDAPSRSQTRTSTGHLTDDLVQPFETGTPPEEFAPRCEELAAGTDVPQDPEESRLSPQPTNGPSLEEPQAPVATVELPATDKLEDSKKSRLSLQLANEPSLEEPQAPTATNELAATDMLEKDPQECRLSPQPADGPSLNEPQAPLSAEREADKTVTRSRRLPPTSSGTALPLSLLDECLLHILQDFSEEDCYPTLYAACLASKIWRDTAQSYLYGIIRLHFQDGSERPLRLLASLLKFRRLAKHTLQLTLKVRGAALVDVAAAASLFGDFTRVQSLSLTFSRDELFILGPHWALYAPLRFLYLHGPISSLMLKIISYLRNLERLTLDGPLDDRLADFRRLPTFELEELSISRDFPQIAIYRLTLLSFATLTKLTLTASDTEQAPELSYLVSLRELEILQPYRDTEPVKNKHKTVKNKPLDARAIAAYVERLLASARQLPQLRCLAFLNPWDLQSNDWPDLRSKSASILKALPNKLVVLNLTSAVSAIDFMGLDKLVRNPKSRPVNLQVVAMDKEAKGSLPYSAEDLERDWAENGVKISWTACRVHANFPLVTVTTKTETTAGEESCH
jgi:hypothetical protein